MPKIKGIVGRRRCWGRRWARRCLPGESKRGWVRSRPGIIDRHRLSKEERGKQDVGGRGRPANCGKIGKQDNCQGGGPLSIANRQASLPVALSDICPEEGEDDAERGRREKGKEKIGERGQKPETALEQVQLGLQQAGMHARRISGADRRGYGNPPTCARQIAPLVGRAMCRHSVEHLVWGPAPSVDDAQAWSGRGRRPNRPRRRDTAQAGLGQAACIGLAEKRAVGDTMGWRGGQLCRKASSRFARVVVRAAFAAAKLRDEEWLLDRVGPKATRSRQIKASTMNGK